MKVKFTKLAALLLAGAALLASGCTDYEVDIQEANKRIDQLDKDKASVAELNSQVDALKSMINTLETTLKGEIKDVADDLDALTKLHNALRADFDAKVAEIAGEIAGLKAADEGFKAQIADLLAKYQNLQDNKADKTELEQAKTDLLAAIAGEKARAEAKEAEIEAAVKKINEETIPALEARIKDLEEVVIPALKQDIQDLKDGKVDKVDFEAYKQATAQTIKDMQDAIGDLAELKTANKESLVEALNEVFTKLDDYVLTTTFEAFVEIAATKEELKALEATMDGRLKELEALTAGFPEGTTIKAYIDGKIADLQGQLNKLTNAEGTGRVDMLEQLGVKLYNTVYNTILPQVQFALDYVGDYGIGLQGYIDDGDAWALSEAKEFTRGQIELVMGVIEDLRNEIFPLLTYVANRIQSVVYVPDYDDLKMTMNLVYYSDYEGHFLVVGKETEVEYKVNPADAFVNLATLNDLIEKNLLAFDVKEVKTRADGEAQTNDPKLDILRATKYDPATGKFTLVVRPNNVVSAAFADNQINPCAMYFALLNNKPAEKATEIEIAKNEDGTYKIVNIPFGPDFSTFQYTEDDIVTGYETIVDQEAWDEEIGFWWYWWWISMGTVHHDAITHEEPIYTPYVWYAYSAEDLAKYKDAIAELQEALNNFVEDDVEKFNELVEKYNAAVDAYNGALASYFKALQRRTAARNYAVALNIYTSAMAGAEEDEVVENPNTDISSTYTTLYPSKYEDSEKIIIEKDPFKKTELTETGDVVAYGDRNQDLEFNSKKTLEILDGAIPAVTITSADGASVRTLSYEQARKEGYLVVDPTWSNAEITYIPADEKQYFVVVNEFEGKIPPYATVRMNYDEYNNAVLKARVDDVVKGDYTLKDNMFSNVWNWVGTVTVVPPTANIDLTIADPITWTYANDATVDHDIFYDVEGTYKMYYRTDQKIVINTDLSEIAKEYGITPKDLLGIEPTDKGRNFITYNVEVVDNSAEPADTYSYDVRFVDGAYIPYVKNEVAEKISPLMINNVDLATDPVGLDMNITNFEWDKTYTVKANYYYLEGNKVSVIVAVKFVFSTVDRNREPVVLPVNEFTFDINGFDEKTGFGYIANAEDAAKSWYKWVGAPQQAEIKTAFEAVNEANGRSVTKAADFKDLAAFAASELTQKVAPAAEPGNAAWYVSIDNNDQHGYTNDSFVASILQKFAEKDEDGNFVQDAVDPYKYLGKEIYRNITTYIGQEVVIPFKFNWKVPAYDFLHQTNYTFDDGKWYTMASPLYDVNKNALKKYDVSYMNVPALAFNIIDANKRFFNYRDEEIAADDPTYFYDPNVFVNFYYTGPDPVDKTELEAQSQTGAIKTYGDLWFNATEEGPYYNVDEAKNFEHTVFYYRSIRDAIPMYGTIEVKSGDARFPVPTSFEKGNGGKYVAQKDYSNYELRAWKPFYVPTYSQQLTLDLNDHRDYYVNLLEGIQFYDARQVAASTPVTNNNEFAGEGVYALSGFNYGVKSYFRPMLGFNPVKTRDNQVDSEKGYWGWILGNTDAAGSAGDAKANGFYEGVTSWEAYDLQVKDFNFSYDSAVSPDLRRLVTVDEENFVLKFDYNSQIEFQNTAKVQFSFDFQTPWQKFEKPFMVEVTIRGLDQQ